jgi:hypothetical protein
MAEKKRDEAEGVDESDPADTSPEASFEREMNAIIRASKPAP